MRKICSFLAIILTLSAFFGGCAKKKDFGKNEYKNQQQNPASVTAYWLDGSDFTPVLRFVAASDVHVFPSYTVNAESRLKNLFVDAYAYAETQEYKTVDAVILNGDLCESGRSVEFAHLMQTINENVRAEETIVWPIIAGHECIEMQLNQNASDKVLFEYFKGYTGIDPGVHMEINGYHFIGIATTQNGLPEGYGADWLKKEMKKATEDNPEKPVFVFNHHPFVNTTVATGSDVIDLPNWPQFDGALDNYPQTVYFSAHLHSAVQHARAIMQHKFTSIDCGAVNYYSAIADNRYEYYESTTYPPKAVEGSCMQIIEVDNIGRIRILPYNLNSRKFMSDPGVSEKQLIRYIQDASDPTTWLYTQDRNKNTDKPYFPNGVISVKEILPTSVKFSFEQAKDQEGVEGYIVKIKEKASGNVVATKKVTSLYYIDPIPQTREVVIENVVLETVKDYIIEVVALDFFGKESVPITKEFYVNTANSK